MLEDSTIAVMLDAHPNYLASFAGAPPAMQAAEPADVSDAVIWLASDLSRVATGSQVTVDTGATKI